MRVLLIANYLPDAQYSMQRYSMQLLDCLRARKVNVEICFPLVCFGKITQTQSGPGKWLGYIDKYIITTVWIWFKTLFIRRYELVHICDHSNSHYVFGVCRCPALITCHDMIAVRAARGEFTRQRVGRTGRLQQKLILKGISAADAVISVSRATKSDLQRILGNKCPEIVVIGNAIEEEFMKFMSPPPVEGSGKYVLHVGGNSWYKNRVAVFRAFKIMSDQFPDLKLRIVGPQLSREELNKVGHQLEAGLVEFTPGVSDDELREIYSRAEILLFPSLIEGYGWPIVEAQACGCPVACLNLSPMNELNALPDLLLDVETESSSWPEYAAEICSRHVGLAPGEREQLSLKLQQFTSSFSLRNLGEKINAEYHKLALKDH